MRADARGTLVLPAAAETAAAAGMDAAAGAYPPAGTLVLAWETLPATNPAMRGRHLDGTVTVLWHGRRGEVPLIDDAVAHECGHAAPRDILVRELGGPDGATAYGALHCDPDDARTLAALDGLADRSARLDTLRAAWAASPNAHGPCGSSCPGEWFAEGFRLAVLGDAAWWSWTPDPAIRGILGG